MNGTNSRHIIQGNGRVSCNPSEDLTDRPEVWSRCSYLPAATKLGQGNVFTGVCDSLHRGEGVCLSACWDTPPGADPPQTRHPPGSRHPPGADPPSRHPPGSRQPPGPDTTPQPGTPPGADPPRSRHTPQTRYPDQTPPQTRHPPGSRRQHTVNERPVRILLECILVLNGTEYC